MTARDGGPAERSAPAARGPDERRSEIYVRPWRVDLTVRKGVPALVARTALSRLIAVALARAGAPAPASIGLVLADDRELARLNRDAMGRRGPTDVLSFPLLPTTAFPPHPGTRAGDRPTGTRPSTPFVLPPRARPHLGDVVVSVERAVAQAQSGRGGQSGRTRWAAADELRLLVVHGTLHVCGWDHADAEEAAAMRALEAELLGAAGEPACPA